MGFHAVIKREREIVCTDLQRCPRYIAKQTRQWPNYTCNRLPTTSFMYTRIGLCSVTKTCPTFCHPMDYSTPDSHVHGIFQTKILGWVAISASRESS